MLRDIPQRSSSLEGRPCRALSSGAISYPGFGRPCRAAHPGLCRDRPCRALYYLRWFTQGLVALAGLRTLGFEKGRPAGAYSAARQLAKELDYRGIMPHPALHGIKGPRCGSPPAGLRDCSPGLTPTAVQAPIGATPTKPRVRSPERATKPWVSHSKRHRALQGRPLDISYAASFASLACGKARPTKA